MIPRITTRGYYDLATGKTIKKNRYFLYPQRSFRRIYGSPEIVIMAHGLRNDRAGAVKKFNIAKKRLKELEYRGTVIGYSYDSNTKGAHLRKEEKKALKIGQKVAKKNGGNMARFILDFKKGSPHTKIRLMGHSLGTEVIISALERLHQQDIVESVHFFGSSVEASDIWSKREILEERIRTRMVNYYSPTDEVLKDSVKKGFLQNPLGLMGLSKKPFRKYRQIRVVPVNHRFASYAKVLNSFP